MELQRLVALHRTYTLNPRVLSGYGRPVAAETNSSPAQATSCELVLKTRGEGRLRKPLVPTVHAREGRLPSETRERQL